MRGEPFQKLVIRSRVAVEAGYHESPKLALVKMSEFVHLSAAPAFQAYAIAGTLLQF